VFLPLAQADIDRKKASGADVSKMKAHGPLPCTLKVRLAKNKRGHSWHVPEVQDCSVPFSNLPATAVVADEQTHFGIGVLMTRLIQLTQGKQAIVSDEDYDLLVSAGPWYAMKRRESYYVNGGPKGQRLAEVCVGL
jgi:hypothetical protein